MTMRISVEFFPASTPENHKKLEETMIRYATEVKMDFVSLTCGAGGSDIRREFLLAAMNKLAALDLKVIAHLPHLGRSKTEVTNLLKDFSDAGAVGFLALRGDTPTEAQFRPHPDGFSHTSEFVQHIKGLYPNAPIYVAGYPEKHPESSDTDTDLHHLKQKINGGASGILGQFCFDSALFSQWKEKCYTYGITANTDIIPGIIGLMNYERMCSRAKEHGVTIPDWVHQVFKNVTHGTEAYSKASQAAMREQLDSLQSAGEDRVHVYALNSRNFVDVLSYSQH